MKVKFFFISMIFVSIICTQLEAEEDKDVNKDVSGTIKKVEFLISSGGYGHANRDCTIIKFDDGRVILFDNILRKIVFQEGRKYTITFIYRPYDSWKDIPEQDQIIMKNVKRLE